MKYPLTTLTIDLKAIADNYQILQSQASGAECAAVVKANAYGLGLEKVARTLYDQGCRKFFVAYLDEAIELRSYLNDVKIYVFHGVQNGEQESFIEYNIIPVISSLEQAEIWALLCRNTKNNTYALHIDTGMNRLGISFDETNKISLMLHFNPKIIMSHLACADEKNHKLNKVQLNNFRQAISHFPNSEYCLANSSGIFLGSNYHFDMLRPGCALYGINPTTKSLNPMNNVVNLESSILQIRNINKGESVGYGASFIAQRDSLIAIISVGYADGYFRCLGGNNHVYISGKKAPVIGRVSMDLITVDVTDIIKVLHETLKVGTKVELLGKNITVDEIAKNAGTIGYEVLTQLGSRYKRLYLE